jgi:hypothetical protein
MLDGFTPGDRRLGKVSAEVSCGAAGAAVWAFGFMRVRYTIGTRRREKAARRRA